MRKFSVNPNLLRCEPQFGNQHPFSRLRAQITGHRSASVKEAFLTTDNAFVTLCNSRPFFADPQISLGGFWVMPQNLPAEM